MNPKVFNSKLVTEGIAIQEMLKLLRLYNEVKDYKTLREIVFRENYLAKNSDIRIENILEAFRKRFLSGFDLPPPDILGKFVESNLSDAAKIQVLLPYYIYSDCLLKFTYFELVIKNLKLGEGLSISHSDVLNFLTSISKKNNIRKWSKNLKKKWATRFLTFLRTFRMLGKYPDAKLRKIHLMPTTFAFYTLWFTSNGLSFQSVLSHEIWDFYLLTRDEILEAAYYGNKRGWWIIETSGGLISFQPNYTIWEWIKHGME